MIDPLTGAERRLDYINLRKKLYGREYIRLIRALPEYKTLLEWFCAGHNLIICEIDVPRRGKKGEYGVGVDDDGNCEMTIEKLDKLINDPSESCGHGLFLALALLQDATAAKI